MVKIYVDSREITSRIPEALQELGAEVATGNLESGDYILRHDIVIERKTAADFIASILDERLMNQVGKMKLSFKTVIFLIEGDVYATRSKIRSEAIDGALSYLTVILGCSVLYYKSPGKAAALLYRMAKHAQEGLGYEIAFRKGKVPAGKAQALFAIEGLPGTGPVTSKKLLNYFRSLRRLFNASVDELKQVNGVGPLKALRIFEGINYELPEGDTADKVESLFADEPAEKPLV